MRNKYELFNDLKKPDAIQKWIYGDHSSLGINQLFGQIVKRTNSKEETNKDKLYKTLDYLYPLIKEGKLEVKIMDSDYEIDTNGSIKRKSLTEKEYKKDEAEQAIENIKTQWLDIYNSDINENTKDTLLDTLGTIYVQFKLPDGFYTY